MPGVGCWGLLGSVCWGFRDKGMESPGRAWHTQEQRGNRQILGPLGVPTPPPGPHRGGGDALAWWQVCSEHFYGLLIVMLPFNSECHSLSAEPDRRGFMPPNYGAWAVRR